MIARHVTVRDGLGSGLERLRHVGPPIAYVPAVPAHGRAQTFGKGHALAPAQELELGAVDPVVVVVERPVGDPDEALAEVVRAVAEEVEHADRDLEVRHGGGGADVVRFAHGAFVEDRVEAVGRVGAVQVAPDVEARALDREGLLIGQEGEEAGYDFYKGKNDAVRRASLRQTLRGKSCILLSGN